MDRKIAKLISVVKSKFDSNKILMIFMRFTIIFFNDNI